MENEEERHKFEAKQTSDEKVTSKTVKPGARVSICGLQMVNFEQQTMQPRTRAPLSTDRRKTGRQAVSA
jgi:hypothetical protein